MKKALLFILFSILTISQMVGQNITREYDEFTGETFFKTNMESSLNFKKVVAENGDWLMVLSWVDVNSFSTIPSNGDSVLTLLFDDNTRMTINIYLVYTYDKDITEFAQLFGLTSELAYRINGEAILNASQIAMLKEKRVKKYRIGDTGNGSEIKDPELFKNSFLSLLYAK